MILILMGTADSKSSDYTWFEFMLFGPFCVNQLSIKYNFSKWWLEAQQGEHRQKLHVQ